ncbi:DUF3488 domain-containing protein [Nonomuraea sediminis]|uniref:DUF3488 domain-containing protein n=1 Tax=Nonomuraea sediminis TaxID=2835864 RepID=UPI001BDCD017|nr:hypothetical protein [Nonomuraea sediminis]
MRRRTARAFAPPLDLRFIDLFMAIILALSFIAIMLTVVARMLPTDAATPPAPTARKETVAELKRQLDAAIAAKQQAETQLRAVKGQAAEHVSFGLPWWLIGLCALLGVIALFLAWRVRLHRGGDLPRLWAWLAGTAVVAAVTWWTRSNADVAGNLRLADLSWWGIDALCLGLLLVAYVLVSSIRESRTTMGQIRTRSGHARAAQPRAEDRDMAQF